MNEINNAALDYAIRSGAQGNAVLPLAKQFAEFLAGDAPKATRGRKSKDDTAPADGAASEPSSPNASQLEPADEPKQDTGAYTQEMTEEFTAEQQKIADKIADGLTRDDALTAATKFSQEHGVEKLEAALTDVSAKKFSDIPADQYGAFIAAMEKAGKSASALS